MYWPRSTGRDLPFRAFQATGLTGVKPRSRELMVDQRSQAQWDSVRICCTMTLAEQTEPRNTSER